MYIPIVQRELDDFRTMVWNNKKGRKQPRKALPNGKTPAFVYEFPEACEGEYEDHAIALGEEDYDSLGDLDALAPIFDGQVENYIPRELTVILDQIHEDAALEDLRTLELENANQVYITLREHFRRLSVV